MLINKEPVEVQIPFSDGWVRIKRLNWTQLEEARQLRDKRQRETLKDLGAQFVAEAAKAFGSGDSESGKRALEELSYHESNFDTGKLLEYGIDSWSDKAPVTKDNVAELDERTAVFIKQQIVDLVRPPSESEEEDFLPESSAG